MVNRKEAATDRVFQALSDPTRRKILHRISQEDPTVGEIAKPFRMSGPAISKHLKILEEANLITRVKDGKSRRFKLNTQPLSDAQTIIRQLTSFWMGRLANLDKFLKTENKGPKKQ